MAAPFAVDAQVVRGQVVDSITRAPMSGVLVELVGSARQSVAQTRTDTEGLFLLRAPAGTAYHLRVERQGYKPSTFPPFDIAPDQALAYMLLIAPVASSPAQLSDERVAELVQRACPNADPEHPIIVGIVQDAQGRPAPAARVRFAWASLPDVLAQELSVSDVSGFSETDSFGRYAICGVPRESKVSLHASLGDAMSDFSRLEFVGNVVVRGDESQPTVGPFWVEDFTLRERAARRTEVAGRVTDSENGRPIPDATVSIVELEGVSTTTNAEGAFLLSGLPAGPAHLAIRKFGTEPARFDITLPNDGRLTVPDDMLAIGSRTELDPITVEARPAPHPLDEFNERRANGQGSFMTRDEWVRLGNPSRATDVLARMQGVRLEPGTDIQHQRTVSMRRAGPRTFGYAGGALDGSNCPPLYFLDRQYIGTANTVDIDATISLMDLQAIEAHGSTAALPVSFSRRGSECGVIAFWTHRAQPRTFEIQEKESFFTSTTFHFALAIAAVVGIFIGLGEAIHF